MIRKIVQIDQEKCNGCGLCVPSCAEGAIKIVNGKAVLSADNLCDGLGACLGDCPMDAINIIEREADEFDESAVEQHLEQIGREPHAPHAPQAHHAHHGHQHGHNHGHHHHGGGCPGSRSMTIERPVDKSEAEAGSRQSQLRQWPVQLHLVPTSAPYFQDADILIAADCVPFAYGDFHKDFLKGKALVIGCPKLDDNNFYLEKLTELFRNSSIRSITVARMEVPCCGGIVMAARQALAASGKSIPFIEVTIGVDGEIR
ncbi:MAG: 4Fe-4S binding protein [Geobacter sp.]|nr:4Fe-4S binding protein [Geobacter sp.]